MHLATLVSKLSSIPAPQNEAIFEKLALFANCDAKAESKHPVDTDVFIPDFARLDVVRCDFTGVGFEWDGPHIAIVWDVHPQLDSIMVIPTTSQPREERDNVFSVGRIQGLNDKDTTLLIADMTRVSRKRLTELTWTHPKKGSMRVRLPKPWLQRINEAITLSLSLENSFSDYLMHNYGAAMVPNLRLLDEWKYKPVKCSFNAGTNTLHFRLWNDTKVNQVTLVTPNTGMYISLGDKAKMIRNLISSDSARRAAAEATFEKLYK